MSGRAIPTFPALFPALFCALAALVAGCASSPPPHFYTLSATPGAVAESAVSVVSSNSPNSPLAIAVGPVTVPAIVNRQQIVVSTGPNAVRLDDANRWASPLPDNLSRVVAENLARRLATPRVSLFPQGTSADAEYRVTIDVQAFESAPGKSALLDATWTVRRMSDGATRSGRSKRVENVDDASYEALAAAHSRALARLSDDLGGALRRLAGQAAD